MKYSKIYTLIVIIGIILVASIFLITSWMSALTVTGMNHAPINEFEVQVFVNRNDPLTLTLNLISLNDHHDIVFRRVEIFEKNTTLIAEHQGKLVGGIYEWKKREPLFDLPAETEKVVRINFNTTLSQGKYSVVLYGYFGKLLPISYSDFIVYENLERIYH